MSFIIRKYNIQPPIWQAFDFVVGSTRNKAKPKDKVGNWKSQPSIHMPYDMILHMNYIIIYDLPMPY